MKKLCITVLLALSLFTPRGFADEAQQEPSALDGIEVRVIQTPGGAFFILDERNIGMLVQRTEDLQKKAKQCGQML